MSRLSKIADRIEGKVNQFVATRYFLLFCFVFPFVPLAFPSTMMAVMFISSSLLQLALLPVIIRQGAKQEKHNEKVMTHIEKLVEHIDKEHTNNQ